jgi:hypothetical protein
MYTKVILSRMSTDIAFDGMYRRETENRDSQTVQIPFPGVPVAGYGRLEVPPRSSCSDAFLARRKIDLPAPTPRSVLQHPSGC